MAGFPIKKNLKEADYCKVCRKKTTEGKILQGYEDNIDFICNNCYKEFFKDLAKIERNGPAVRFRPARIIQDEYRVHWIFAEQTVREILVWLIVGGAIWAILMLIGALIPDVNGPLASYGLVPMVIYVFFSVIGSLNALQCFMIGLFRGMNGRRRILLGVKCILYLGMAAVFSAMIFEIFK